MQAGQLTKKSGDEMTNNKSHEEICLECDGCGTLPDSGAPHGVMLCHKCNGHGVVVYIPDVNTGNRIGKYKVNDRVAYSRWIN